MIPALIPAIGAGISGLMGFLGAKENKEAAAAANLMNFQLAQAAQNTANQHFWTQVEMSNDRHRDQLAENAATRALNLDINAKNIALQREFAQHGIQWRVQDALAAGVHPMAALGGSGATFSPAAHVQGGSINAPQISGGGGGVSANITADSSMGNALSNMGQDISRALSATQNAADRADSYTAASQVLTLDNQRLQNELLKSQIARLRQTPNPPMPVNQRFGLDGQGQTAVKTKEGEITGRDPRQPQSEAHSIPDVGYAQTKTGYAPVPSKDVKERIEDNFIQEVMWAFRNNVLPSFGFNKSPPNFNDRWYFNPLKQEYQRGSMPKNKYERLIKMF